MRHSSSSPAPRLDRSTMHISRSVCKHAVHSLVIPKCSQSTLALHAFAVCECASAARSVARADCRARRVLVSASVLTVIALVRLTAVETVVGRHTSAVAEEIRAMPPHAHKRAVIACCTNRIDFTRWRQRSDAKRDAAPHALVPHEIERLSHRVNLRIDVNETIACTPNANGQKSTT
jgi:hypothetical protein